MKKFIYASIIAVLLIISTLSSYASQETALATITGTNIKLTQSESGTLILSGYDSNGILRFCSISSDGSCDFDIPAKYTNLDMRLCIADKNQTKNLLISVPSPSPLPSPLPSPSPTVSPQPSEEPYLEQEANKRICMFSISCSSILSNPSSDPELISKLPGDGMILPETEIEIYDGATVYDVLVQICNEYGIELNSSYTSDYNSSYVEGIYGIYEFDCGPLSGWMYSVNGVYYQYGSSDFFIQDGDIIQWNYTCDLGADLGA